MIGVKGLAPGLEVQNPMPCLNPPESLRVYKVYCSNILPSQVIVLEPIEEYWSACYVPASADFSEQISL